MSDLTLLLGLTAVVALVAANGLFVATEFAYVAVRRTRIEHLANRGHARARLLMGSLAQLDMFIAANPARHHDVEPRFGLGGRAQSSPTC